MERSRTMQNMEIEKGTVPNNGKMGYGNGTVSNNRKKGIREWNGLEQCKIWKSIMEWSRGKEKMEIENGKVGKWKQDDIDK